MPDQIATCLQGCKEDTWGASIQALCKAVKTPIEDQEYTAAEMPHLEQQIQKTLATIRACYSRAAADEASSSKAAAFALKAADDASSSQAEQSSAQSRFIFQQITSLKLFPWTEWKASGQDGIWHYPLDDNLWQGLQTAEISHLTLGEFMSEDFCDRLPDVMFPGYLPDLWKYTPCSPGLQNLRSLTLHFNLIGIGRFFNSDLIKGGMSSLHALSQLTSLSIRANEVHPAGGRTRIHCPAERLLCNLPDSIQSLALHNFRDRWPCFGDLFSRPSLVSLDLTASSFIVPDAQAWTQLQQLHLQDSLVWLTHGQPFHFSSLTVLTMLDLNGCYFGVYSPGQLGNTHHFVYERLQAPTTIVLLDLSTRYIKVTFL